MNDGKLTCAMCGVRPATGKFGLCPACKADVAERSKQRQAALAPTMCIGCRVPLAPTPGHIYCPHCARRFGVPIIVKPDAPLPPSLRAKRPA